MQIVSLKKLEDALGRVAKRLHGFYWSRSVLANVLISSQGRPCPLVIESGTLKILRAVESTPGTPEHQRLEQLATLSKDLGYELREVESGLFLQCRSFASDTLLLAPMQAPSTSRESALAQFLPVFEQLRKLHGAGLAHGNVCKENLAVEAGRAALVDFCCRLQSGPELQLQDLKGFADALVSVNATILSEADKALLSSDSPSLDDMTRLFSAAARKSEVEKSRIIRAGGDSAFRGRILDIDSAASAKQEPSTGIIQTASPELPKQGDLEVSRAEPSSIVSERPAQPQRNPQEQRTASSSVQVHSGAQELPEEESGDTLQRFTFIALGAFVMLVGIVGLGSQPGTSSTLKESFPAREYWLSAEPSKMIKVARFAIKEPRSLSRKVVSATELPKNAQRYARSALLEFVFQKSWAADIPESERKFLLSIALQPLLEELLSPKTSPQSFHPVTLLASLGFFPTSTAPDFASEVPIDRFDDLAGSYGSFFELVRRSTGATSLSDPAAFAAARFLVGNYRPGIADSLFGKTQNEQIRELLYRALVTILLTQSENALSKAYDDIAYSETVYAKRLFWFEDPSLSALASLSASQKLKLSAGIADFKGLSLDSFAELLRFPEPSVRKQAGAKIQAMISEPTARRFFAGLQEVAERLSPQDLSLLIATLISPQSQQGPLFSQWLKKLAPKPDTVFELLNLVKTPGDMPDFVFHAVRYLSSKQGGRWRASLLQKRAMLGHPDEFVRTFAYSLLDPAEALERELLEQSEQVEPSERLRKRLGEILAAYRE